jgi:HPr kinase/phosphorylase
MTPPKLTARQLFEALREKLRLEWLAGSRGADRPVAGASPEADSHALVGGLNWIHPNRIQVIGRTEQRYLSGLDEATFRSTVQNLFAAEPAVLLFAEDLPVQPPFIEAAEAGSVPVLRSPLPDSQLIFELQYYLTKALAVPITVHGVFMEIMGVGVLLTGEAGIGKSELALELVTRGHRLIADDAPIFSRIAPDTVNGTCPPLLNGFLEVRGLGVLNILAMFGNSAIRSNRYLRLILHLERQDNRRLAEMDRLDGSFSDRQVLEVEIPQITLPVAPGRNLAILAEAAVRNYLLRRSGYYASRDFSERQLRLLDPEPGRS